MDKVYPPDVDGGVDSTFLKAGIKSLQWFSIFCFKNHFTWKSLLLYSTIYVYCVLYMFYNKVPA